MGGAVYPLGSTSVVPTAAATDAQTAAGAASAYRLAGGTRSETAVTTYPRFAGMFTRSSATIAEAPDHPAWGFVRTNGYSPPPVSFSRSDCSASSEASEPSGATSAAPAE